MWVLNILYFVCGIFDCESKDSTGDSYRDVIGHRNSTCVQLYICLNIAVFPPMLATHLKFYSSVTYFSAIPTSLLCVINILNRSSCTFVQFTIVYYMLRFHVILHSIYLCQFPRESFNLDVHV